MMLYPGCIWGPIFNESSHINPKKGRLDGPFSISGKTFTVYFFLTQKLTVNIIIIKLIIKLLINMPILKPSYKYHCNFIFLWEYYTDSKMLLELDLTKWILKTKRHFIFPPNIPEKPRDAFCVWDENSHFEIQSKYSLSQSVLGEITLLHQILPYSNTLMLISHHQGPIHVSKEEPFHGEHIWKDFK